MELFVALLLPYSDGSGETEIIGVYDTREKAEAGCYRSQHEGYHQPTSITSVMLNLDKR